MSPTSGKDRPPLRARRTATRRLAAPSNRSAMRAEAVRDIERELESWRERAIPELSAPLDAEAVARLVSECLLSLGLSEAANTSFTVNTVHFYRRKEILDPPEGRTSAARYTVRHLWQAIGARLAGQLALLTLAEAREAMAGRSERALLAFVAERVLDARARQAARRSTQGLIAARPLSPDAIAEASAPRALPGVAERAADATPALVLSLPGDAWCVVPISHAARRSPAAARALGQALVDAIQLTKELTLES
jgi:hypothetical protein